MAALFAENLKTIDLAEQTVYESGQVVECLKCPTLNHVINLHLLAWEPALASCALVLPPLPLAESSLIWASCPKLRVIAWLPAYRHFP
jgi:hypothetical protein